MGDTNNAEKTTLITQAPSASLSPAMLNAKLALDGIACVGGVFGATLGGGGGA